MIAELVPIVSAAVLLGLLLAWVLLNPDARAHRRRTRYLRRKYPMAHDRDLRRMSRADRERTRVSRRARR